MVIFSDGKTGPQCVKQCQFYRPYPGLLSLVCYSFKIVAPILGDQYLALPRHHQQLPTFPRKRTGTQ